MIGSRNIPVANPDPTPLSYAGADTALFGVTRTRRFALLAPNLSVSNKPSEHNVGIMPAYHLVAQLPPSRGNSQRFRIFSRYAQLPIGQRFKTTFGSS